MLRGGGGSGGGSGDTTGAASSTDNAVARFDGVTGKTLQNSSVIIDDQGSIGIDIAPYHYGADVILAMGGTTKDGYIELYNAAGDPCFSMGALSTGGYVSANAPAGNGVGFSTDDVAGNQVYFGGSDFILNRNFVTEALRINNSTGLVTVGVVRTTPLTVATLPAAATAGAGARSFVTDANTTHILGLGLTVAGGGANNVPVYSDGTNWKIG